MEITSKYLEELRTRLINFKVGNDDIPQGMKPSTFKWWLNRVKNHHKHGNKPLPKPYQIALLEGICERKHLMAENIELRSIITQGMLKKNV